MDLRDLRHHASELLTAGRYAQAEVTLRQLLLQTPRDGLLWVRHAEALRRIERTAEAVESYRTAAQMLEGDGQFARAVAALKLALGLRPEDLDLISELIRLEVQKNRDAAARRLKVTSVLDDDAPDDDLSRRATLQFPISELARPSAPLLALPARTHVTVEVPEVRHLTPVPAPPTPGPLVRRLSEREVAVQTSPDGPWLVVSSESPVEVRMVDGSDLPVGTRG